MPRGCLILFQNFFFRKEIKKPDKIKHLAKYYESNIVLPSNFI